MNYLLIVLVALTSTISFAATRSLESELKSLDIKGPVPSSKLVERIYAVQSRATTLQNRPEIAVALAENFGGSGFLASNQWTAEARFHFSDRFSMAAAYSYVSNKFTGAAKNLEEQSGYLPDVDYVKSRYEARLLYNVFYGKFRFTRRQALSFDQYIGVGAAQNDLRSGTSTGPLGDLGFAFWFGQHLSIRLGAKDYYYSENRTLSQGYSHNVHGYLQTGYIF